MNIEKIWNTKKKTLLRKVLSCRWRVIQHMLSVVIRMEGVECRLTSMYSDVRHTTRGISVNVLMLAFACKAGPENKRDGLT